VRTPGRRGWRTSGRRGMSGMLGLLVRRVLLHNDLHRDQEEHDPGRQQERAKGDSPLLQELRAERCGSKCADGGDGDRLEREPALEATVPPGRHFCERADDLEWPDHDEQKREDLAGRERVGRAGLEQEHQALTSCDGLGAGRSTSRRRQPHVIPNAQVAVDRRRHWRIRCRSAVHVDELSWLREAAAGCLHDRCDLEEHPLAQRKEIREIGGQDVCEELELDGAVTEIDQPNARGCRLDFWALGEELANVAEDLLELIDGRP